MSTQDVHVQWKTDAWKDPGTVASYDRRMGDLSGWNLLKNRVEIGIFERFVTGGQVLDVGIGTGRASLPLARRGRCVTGVDSSQAMLDKCAELAGPAPIDLRLGDVTSLPFAGESFDTVMSLNTMTHFPHWKAIMQEWRRVVRPGGEMIFDAYSLDHDIAFARAIGQPEEYGIHHFAARDVGNFFLRVCVEELVDYAQTLGLRVRAIVPYSVVFGRAGWNRFFDGSPLTGNSWDRLLSWVYADPKLFDFLTFLEEEFVSKLTTQTACRFMAVFDVAGNDATNQAWIRRNRDYNAELAKGLLPATLARFGGMDVDAVREKLNDFLAHEPCRFTLARMMLANRRWKWPMHLDQWVDERYRGQLEHVLALGTVDEIVLALLRSLDRSPEIAQTLTYNGVSLAAAFEYDFMSAALDQGFDVFAHSFGG